MDQSWYDTAIICRNGHVVNAAATAYPATTTDFCDRCGAPALSQCPTCTALIRGEFHLSGNLTLIGYTIPAYCPSCGQPYPWTQIRLLAAAELADAMERLTPQERELLKVSIRAVVCDDPTAPVAVIRLKQLLAKVGAAAAQSFQQILTDVVSEAIRKALWGPSG